MNLTENRRKYKETIGEFIISFAEVELYLSLYDAIIQTKNTINPNLVISFAKNLSEKLNNVDTFIKAIGNDSFYINWSNVQAEIKILTLNRHHIVHGTGHSDFHAETITTILDEGKRKEKHIQLSAKKFTIIDLKALCDRTHHLLTGVNGIQGFFFQEFLKNSREYFAR